MDGWSQSKGFKPSLLLLLLWLRVYACVSVNLMGLLKWRDNPKDLESYLRLFMKVDGEEIVKVGETSSLLLHQCRFWQTISLPCIMYICWLCYCGYAYDSMLSVRVVRDLFPSVALWLELAVGWTAFQQTVIIQLQTSLFRCPWLFFHTCRVCRCCTNIFQIELIISQCSKLVRTLL